jgi:hypothetical protein
MIENNTNKALDDNCSVAVDGMKPVAKKLAAAAQPTAQVKSTVTKTSKTNQECMQQQVWPEPPKSSRWRPAVQAGDHIR